MNPTDYADVVKEYDRRAPFYDRHWQFYIEVSTRETVVRLSLPGHCELLDMGCGTGSLIHRILECWPSVKTVGVDVSLGMLHVAHRKLGREVRLVCADAHRLPFESENFDVVICCNTFHFLRKPIQVLKEVKRVLRPGGELVITDWCDDFLVCRLCDLYLRFFNPAHFRMYKGRQCRSLLEHAGFRIIELERYKISWLWGLMTVRAKCN